MGTNLTKEQKAFLDTIAYFEGTIGRSANGYDLGYGAKVVMNGWKETGIIFGHGYVKSTQYYKPKVKEKADPTWFNSSSSSSAAGRYAFIGSSWSSRTLKLGLGENAPMTKDNQALVAWSMAKDGGVTDKMLTDGLKSLDGFKKLIGEVGNIWEAFKRSLNNNYVIKVNDGWTFYKGAFEKYKQGVVQPISNASNQNSNTKEYKVQSDSYILKGAPNLNNIKIFKGLTFTTNDGKVAISKKSKNIQTINLFGSVTNTEEGYVVYDCKENKWYISSSGTLTQEELKNKFNKDYFWLDESGTLTKNLKSKLELCSGKDPSKANLPIKITGSYTAKGLGGDALHSFNRRKSDKFGGYIFRTDPIPDIWKSRSKIGTQGGVYAGKGVNAVLEDLVSKGIKAEVSKIEINIDWKEYAVSWSVTIDKSKDGKTYIGGTTVGSIGSINNKPEGKYDFRADKQVPELKADNSEFKNWKTPTLVYNGKTMNQKFKEGYIPLEDTTHKLRQYFFIYTK